MAAPLAHIFGIAVPLHEKAHKLSGNGANHRMLDLAKILLRLQERMPASTDILDEVLPFGYGPDVMAKNAAPISRPLGKARLVFERVRRRGNQELVAAAVANVLVQMVSVSETSKLMAAEEA